MLSIGSLDILLGIFYRFMSFNTLQHIIQMQQTTKGMIMYNNMLLSSSLLIPVVSIMIALTYISKCFSYDALYFFSLKILINPICNSLPLLV